MFRYLIGVAVQSAVFLRFVARRWLHRYRAPEVAGANYSFSADVFSLGVILHFMLSGFVPEPEEVTICDTPEWDEISQPAKGVIQLRRCSYWLQKV